MVLMIALTVFSLVVAVVALTYTILKERRRRQELTTADLSVFAQWQDGNAEGELGATLYFDVINNGPVPVSVFPPWIISEDFGGILLGDAAEDPENPERVIAPHESWTKYIRWEDVQNPLGMPPPDQRFRLVFWTHPPDTFETDWLAPPEEAVPYLEAPLSEIEDEPSPLRDASRE